MADSSSGSSPVSAVECAEVVFPPPDPGDTRSFVRLNNNRVMPGRPSALEHDAEYAESPDPQAARGGGTCSTRT